MGLRKDGKKIDLEKHTHKQLREFCREKGLEQQQYFRWTDAVQYLLDYYYTFSKPGAIK